MTQHYVHQRNHYPLDLVACGCARVVGIRIASDFHLKRLDSGQDKGLTQLFRASQYVFVFPPPPPPQTHTHTITQTNNHSVIPPGTLCTPTFASVLKRPRARWTSSRRATSGWASTRMIRATLCTASGPPRCSALGSLANSVCLDFLPALSLFSPFFALRLR